MPSSHCTILAQFFTRRQVLINRRHMPEIGHKAVLVHASENRAVWIIKDAICGNRWYVRRRHPWNIRHAKYLFHNLAVWMSSDWKIHWRWPTVNERARYTAVGSSGRTFFFFTKLLTYKKCAYTLALEYIDQVGHMKIWSHLSLKVEIPSDFCGKKNSGLAISSSDVLSGPCGQQGYRMCAGEMGRLRPFA